MPLTEERVREMQKYVGWAPHLTTLAPRNAEVKQLAADWLALRQQVKDLTPPPHERFVRCSTALVEEIRYQPTPPVTLQITERPDGFCEFLALRQYAYEDLVKQNAALRLMVEEAVVLAGEMASAADAGCTATMDEWRQLTDLRARLAVLGEP